MTGSKELNLIEELKNRLVGQFPNVEASLDAPSNPGAAWLLDMQLDDHSVTVEWRPGAGLGILSSDDVIYGEGVHEVFPDLEPALARVAALLRGRSRTSPPNTTILRELRRSRRMSQEELARRLRVRQAAVSKFERRSDIRISTLKSFVTAMGGELELHVKFPEEVVVLNATLS